MNDETMTRQCDWWLPDRSKCPERATVVLVDADGAPLGFCDAHLLNAEYQYRIPVLVAVKRESARVQLGKLAPWLHHDEDCIKDNKRQQCRCGLSVAIEELGK